MECSTAHYTTGQIYSLLPWGGLEHRNVGEINICCEENAYIIS